MCVASAVPGMTAVTRGSPKCWIFLCLRDAVRGLIARPTWNEKATKSQLLGRKRELAAYSCGLACVQADLGTWWDYDEPHAPQ
jgi:hypothetical protein